jgi:putative ABC transport system permease protein
LVRIYLVESLLYAAVAIGAGPFLALPVARAIGATSGFLSFSPGSPFPVAVQGQTFLIGAIAAALAVLAGLAAAFRAVRRTMAGFKQEQARPRRRSLWQRFYLDVVLLLVSLYGYWVVSRQGPLVTGDQQAALAQDPLIVLAPTVFVIAGTLVAARLLPPLTAVLAALANRSVPALLLALRGISRMPRQYVRLMTLLSLTLAVGVFVAAIAGTIGRSTADEAAFRTGAVLRLIEYDPATHDFGTLPTAWHTRRPGVLAASPALRLETYQAGLTAPGANDQEPILGIDPATLGRVIWFRSDFAGRPLHDLLKTLAATPNGVIVSDAFLGASGLHVGDSVGVAVLGSGFQATIVGAVHYFPTLSTPNGEFGLVSLSTLLQHAQAQGGASGPSEMWLRLNGGAATARTVITAVQATGREVISYQATRPHGLTLLDNPLQVGLYGVVSIGFIIAAGLSTLSFFVYAYLSAQRRSGEFAVLRALGITPAQAGGILIAEQVLLMLLGTVAALVIGLLASSLFVPYLPLTDTPIPPLRLEIPWAAVWELVGIVALALLPTLGSLYWLMGHLQVSRVLRMGET